MHDDCAAYLLHDGASLRRLIAPVMALRLRLGGPPETWEIAAAGRGETSRVSIVTGRDGGIVVKQALPAATGDGQPLPANRIHFECMALIEMARIDPRRAPKLLHYEPAQGLIVLEHRTPHAPLEEEWESGRGRADSAAELGVFLARIAASTGDFGLSSARKRGLIGAFAGNGPMAEWTENLLFAYPPDANTELRHAIGRLRRSFVSHQEVLIHGALTPRSVLVSDHDLLVISPEFAGMGPLGFDLGTFLAHAACASQLVDAAALWDSFFETFEEYSGCSNADVVAIKVQALGFAGLEMLRLLRRTGKTPARSAPYPDDLREAATSLITFSENYSEADALIALLRIKENTKEE